MLQCGRVVALHRHDEANGRGALTHLIQIDDVLERFVAWRRIAPDEFGIEAFGPLEHQQVGIGQHGVQDAGRVQGVKTRLPHGAKRSRWIADSAQALQAQKRVRRMAGQQHTHLAFKRGAEWFLCRHLKSALPRGVLVLDQTSVF